MTNHTINYCFILIIGTLITLNYTIALLFIYTSKGILLYIIIIDKDQGTQVPTSLIY